MARKSRFSSEQIVAALRRVEAGEQASVVCQELGVAAQTFYRWRAKFGALDGAKARLLQELESENQRLRELVARQALDLRSLKAVLAKKW